MTSTMNAMAALLPAWNLTLLLLLAKATLVVLAAMGITRVMQRASAGTRHLVWLATLAALLLLPVLGAWGPLRIAVLPAHAQLTTDTRAALTTPDASRTVDAGRTSIGTEGPSAVELPTRLAASPPPVEAPRFSLATLGAARIALALWALVVLGVALSLAWAALAVRRIVRGAHPLDDASWTTPLLEISDRLELEDTPRLLMSPVSRMPFACGVLHPTIVLPADAEQWNLERRRAVLLHELAHVRRRDLLGHTLGRLVCAVYWFHPLVWGAARQLRNESERACDDLALACGTRATDYAEHLLDIVTSVRQDATPSVALAMARRKEFEGRMLAILDPELHREAPSRAQSARLIASLAVFAVIIGAVVPVQKDAMAASAQRDLASNGGQATRTTPVPMRVTGVIDDANPQAPSLANPNPNPSPGAMEDPRVDARTDTRARREFTTSTMRTFNADTFTSRRTDTRIDGGMSPRVNAEPVVSPHVTEAIAKASARLGTNVAALLLQSLGDAGTGEKGDKGAKGSKVDDDRPMLLAKILRTDSSAELRRVAAWGLSEYGNSQVGADALRDALRKDADASVREMSAWSLAEMGARTVASVDALIAALRGDQNDQVRATAAWALGEVNDRSAAAVLTSALGDASPKVRMRAAWALGEVQPKEAPKPLIALLGDNDPHVRRLAAWALYNIEDPAAVPALQAALRKESDKDVQLSYIRALAAMGDDAVDALRPLLESTDPRIKSLTVRALAGGHGTGPWPWPWPQPRPQP